VGRVSNYETWTLRKKAAELFKAGMSNEEIASRLNRKPRTIAQWRRELSKAVATEVVQAALDDAEEYRRMMWFWTAEVERLKEELRANPLREVTKVVTNKKTGEQKVVTVMEENTPLVNELSYAIAQQAAWARLWAPAQLAAIKAALSREEAASGPRIQFVFPDMKAVEEWYANIRARRQLVPPLALPEASGQEVAPNESANDVLAELDAFDAEYGRNIKRPEEPA
jgi:IS30 family transposase